LADAVWPRKFRPRTILAHGDHLGDAPALEVVEKHKATRSPSSCAEWRRRTCDEGAALTLQEISRKKPGVENRVAQEIEEASLRGRSAG